MKTFKLKLVVVDTNTKSWQVFLEKPAIQDQVLQWTNEGGGTFSKIIQTYTILDDDLNVFVVCNGYGSTAKCSVTINDSPTGSVTANFDDTTMATKQFHV